MQTTMANERLNSLAILSIEKKTFDVVPVAAIFNKQVQLIGDIS